MAFAETAKLAVRIDLEGNASAGISRLSKQVSGLGGSLQRTGRGVGQLGAGLSRAGLLVGGAAVTGLVAAAKAGGDFEAQLRIINTIARKTPDELNAIGDGIREMARQGRGDLADLSAGFYDILSAGITDAADAQGVLQAATTLASGSLSTNAEAVDLLTTAINSYGQDASAASKDADLFAKAVEIGKVKADEIAGSFANVAPIAAQVGINIEEVAAAYGALTAQGTPAAEVATQMQRAIVELLDPSKQLKKLQSDTGKDFLKIAQDKGLVVALQAMRDAVGDDDAAFKALFGRVEGYKFALQTTGPQQKIYNDALKAMGDAAGTAAEQMAERQQGLNFQVGRLKANLIDAGIELSQGFLPALTRTVDQLSTALNDPTNRESLRNIGKDIGKALDEIDWKDVLKSAKDFVGVLKVALTFAKHIFDVFNALPTEMKGAVAGFLALNKLSGGLIGAGVGNVVGGLGGALAKGIAGKAPGVGALFAQPVYVTNWPMGGIGGLGGLGGAAAGAGAIGGGLALGAITAAVATTVVSTMPFADRNNAQGAKGLTQAERVAVNYYNADRTQQQNIYKRLGYIPEKRDADSGNAKLEGKIKATNDSLAQLKAEHIRRLAAVKQAQVETKRETTKGTALINTSTRTGDANIVAAINAIPVPIVSVNVTGNSVGSVTTKNARYGKPRGSRSQDSFDGERPR